MASKPRVRIRAVGRLYLLPRFPPGMRHPALIVFPNRPTAARISVNGGPPRFFRLERNAT